MIWEVQYYEDEEGSYPVREFIDALPSKHRAKVLWTVGQLEEQGPTLLFPYSGDVEGKLRELRAWFGKTLYRILYYGDPERKFILLHALEKETEQLPEADKRLALQRMRRDMEEKRRERRRK